MMDSTGGGVPLPSLFPSINTTTSAAAVCYSGAVIPPTMFPPLAAMTASPQNLLRGNGQLSWLSPKAGLIECSNPVKATVSFQLKDFCDSQVSDLTTVLRVGFHLAFNAVATGDSSENWIATHVTPITEADIVNGISAANGTGGQENNVEINLEETEQNLSGAPRQSHKDPYSLQMEYQSLTFLLAVFHKSGMHFVSLSSLHSKISNSGREDLYRYIGSSSLKRRQFIERRSYIFQFGENDMVYLQPAEVYTTVCLLASHLLKHGGVTASDALFAFFNNSTTIPMAMKESIQKNRQQFMALLARHLFVFAPFPSQFYVAVRRNLPYFDYTGFIRRNFPGCVFPRVGSQQQQQPQSGQHPPHSLASIPALLAQRPTLGPSQPQQRLGHFGQQTAYEQHQAQQQSTVATPMTPMTPMTPLFPELLGDGAQTHGQHHLQQQAMAAGRAPQQQLAPANSSAGGNMWPPQGDLPPNLSLFDAMAPQHPPQRHNSALGFSNGHVHGGGAPAFMNALLNSGTASRASLSETRRPTDLVGGLFPGSTPTSPIPSLLSNGCAVGMAGMVAANGPSATRRIVVATVDNATQTDSALAWQAGFAHATAEKGSGPDKVCTCQCNCGAQSNGVSIGGSSGESSTTPPTLFSFESAPSMRSMGDSVVAGVVDDEERPYDVFARHLPFDFNQFHLK